LHGLLLTTGSSICLLLFASLKSLKTDSLIYNILRYFSLKNMNFVVANAAADLSKLTTEFLPRDAL